MTKEQLFCAARYDLIDNLVCDDEVKQSIKVLTNADAHKIAQGLV